MSTVKANNYYDASGGSNAQLYGVASPPNSMGFRNRILNGGMVIDQRNAGASVTVNNLAIFYGVDRFRAIGQASSGVFTLQQVSDGPAGFVKSLKVTVTTADASIAASDRYLVQQVIEGNNAADLGFGAAGAATVTISFWVKSSLTGSFGGCLQNDGPARSYPFSYTINAANTWEYKTVTIAGDTSGTWPTDNTGWGRVTWSIGSGSTYTSTAGSWQAGNFEGVTGQVQPISTLNATWQITGVQLEAGTVASPFERRDYGRELMMCQRYTLVLRASSAYAKFAISNATSGGGTLAVFQLPVSLRASPTVSVNAVSTTQSGGGQTNISSISGVIFIGNVIGVEAASATYTANQNVLWQDTGGGVATITMSSEL